MKVCRLRAPPRPRKKWLWQLCRAFRLKKCAPHSSLEVPPPPRCSHTIFFFRLRRAAARVTLFFLKSRYPHKTSEKSTLLVRKPPGILSSPPLLDSWALLGFPGALLCSPRLCWALLGSPRLLVSCFPGSPTQDLAGASRGAVCRGVLAGVPGLS